MKKKTLEGGGILARWDRTDFGTAEPELLAVDDVATPMAAFSTSLACVAIKYKFHHTPRVQHVF